MSFLRSPSFAFVSLSLFAACAAPKPAAVVPPPSGPRAPVAVVVPPSPPSPPPATSGEPARSPVPIDVPTSECTIDVTAPGSAGPFGVGHVYVGAAPIARARALGDLRRARLVFREEKPGVAFVAIDGDTVSILGAVPLHVGTTDDLVLFPRTRILRDGWLDYARLSIAFVGKSTLGPKTELEPGLTPAAAAPFDVACTELTPFGVVTSEPPLDHELRGKAISLEDEKGKKLATIDAETLMPPARGEAKSHVVGRPVAVLAKKGSRTKIRFEAGRDLHAEGWVASRWVRASSSGLVGYGRGAGSAPKLDVLTCERDVPLWVDVQGTTFAVGTVHAHRTVNGKLDEKNDFRVDLGSNARVFASSPPKKGDSVDPYVPRHELAACSDPRPKATRAQE